MSAYVEGKNRVWRLRARPVGEPKKTDLELCVEDIPTITDGQMLVKNKYLSIDPTHRIWMSDRPQYMPPVGIGEIMRGGGIGEVIESKAEGFKAGMHVWGFTGMADYCVGIPNVTIMGEAGPRVAPLPLQAELSVASLIVGLAAWHGMVKEIEPKADEIIVVSGAAGAVGSLAGQLAKIRGAKVVGIAGGPAKCAYLKECGFDLAIDYKSESVDAALKKFAPDGINGYFDNVGGEITDAVLLNFANNGRAAICGSISEYDDKWAGWKNTNMILMRRLMVKGFICSDHADEMPEMTAEVVKLVQEGKLKYKEDIQEGLENYIDVVQMLQTGKNEGKLMIKI